MSSRTIGIALIVALTGSVACLLQLERDISCGDGFVDELAGEECDPADPSSFEDGCRGTSHQMGVAACDPKTCELINDKAQCAVCGDRVVDEDLGEECEGDFLNGQACPGGAGELQCALDCTFDYSACAPCGNTVVDPGEECDPNQGGGFVNPRPCAGANIGEPNEVAPLESPNPNRPFTSGSTATCGRDCRLDRLNCGFCGNGIREGVTPVSSTLTISEEWCDGSLFDQSRLDETFGTTTCTVPGTRVNVPCGDDCVSFKERSTEADCCLKKNEQCPDAADEFQCCYAYDHPEVENPCDEIFGAPEIREVCR